MKHTVQIGKHSVQFKTYKTDLELEVLEELCFSSNQDNDDNYEYLVNDFLSRLCEYNIEKLSKIEKILLVWNIRALTLGDEFTVLYECPFCKRMTSSVVSIDNLCKFGYLTKYNPFDSTISELDFKKLNIDFNSNLLEDLDFDIFAKFCSNSEDFFNIYCEKTELECAYCKKIAYDNYLTYKNCMKFLSEDNFQSLTRWINDLVYYGHFNRSDILDMTPIQRHLHIEYFKQIKKKENGSEGIS